MLKYCCLIVVSLITIGISGIPTTTESVQKNFTTFEDSEPKNCSSACLKTYPPHTYENGNAAGSCATGCRLYSLISNSGSGDFLQLCNKDCMESYDAKSDIKACSFGCSSQVKSVDDMKNQLSVINAGINNQMLFDDMVSHMVYQMMMGFDFFNHMPKKSDFSQSDTIIFVNEQPNSNDLTIISISSPQFGHDIQDTAADSSDAVEVILPEDFETTADPSTSDFYSYCYIIRSNSRLLLCALLMFSTIVLCWLSCSALSTAPKRRVIQQKPFFQNTPPMQEKKTPVMFVAQPPIYTEKASLVKNIEI